MACSARSSRPSPIPWTIRICEARPIGANQYPQRHLSLQFGFARFVGVLRIVAVRATGEGSDVRVRTIVSFALSRTGALVIAHPAFLARSESVILALACRVRIILHPRNTQVCDGHRQLRCAGIKYGSRDRKHGLRVHGTAWRSKWHRRTWREESMPRRSRIFL